MNASVCNSHGQPVKFFGEGITARLNDRSREYQLKEKVHTVHFLESNYAKGANMVALASLGSKLSLGEHLDYL